jgi:1-acyl-sn-glycerol-3-phosphate acyltransferase
MWLLPILSHVSWLLAHLYYRLTVRGPAGPRRGAVMLVANHNNALLDPVMVSVAARRPVRFLAKAPLFTESAIRLLIRASGAIPVYRRQDDASQTGRNVEMFQAVRGALVDGAAVGLFPEGISHSGPALEPLRTGAARIALGACGHRGAAFPIIPVGLVLSQRGRFRSRALILRGAPVEWEDLAQRGEDDREAVRELTGRIEAGLRSVTLNLERWEDHPLVECAEAIWAAEHGADPDPAAGVTRMDHAARILGALRRDESAAHAGVVPRVEQHRRRLKALGLQPRHLGTSTRMQDGMRWAVRRVHLLGIPAMLVAVAGYLLFRIPYVLTGRVARWGRPMPDQVSTFALVVGALVYALWVVALAAAAWWLWGPWAGAASLLWIPLVGVLGLWIRERWHTARRDIRRFFLMRSRSEQMASLRKSQKEIALELQQVYQAYKDTTFTR